MSAAARRRKIQITDKGGQAAKISAIGATGSS